MEPTTEPRKGLGIAFRFVAAYLALYMVPSPLDAVPAADGLSKAVRECWAVPVRWVAAHFFHIYRETLIAETGSGDTTFDYLLIVVMIAIAGAITVVWTLRARSSRDVIAHEVLGVWLRYNLAFTMLKYGLSKVFKAQFPHPDFGRLIEPYGQSSPMALLWTFMGYSTAYTVFAGLAECVGGVLLFWRRTTTLGALVLVAVLCNVVMLNLCYDVPVKLFSSHLLFMAIFLSAPDAGRLLNVLILQRATCPSPARRALPKRWMNRTALAVKVSFIAITVFTLTKGAYEGWREYGDASAPGHLDGLYEVARFERAGVDVPANLAEAPRWRRIAISPHRAIVQRMNDASDRYRAEVDMPKSTMTLTLHGTAAAPFVLAFSRPDSEHLTLRGTVDDATLIIDLKRADTGEQLLTSRGFHWINEYPVNR